jgi:aspartyl-tRNA(Asn)/glutamyl-tRNA(Gln) amidotransferase subunit A
MNINKKTITSLHDSLIHKEFSSVELTEEYYRNIEKNDKDINAYVSLTKEIAIDQAKAIDEKINNGDKIGLISGIPLALKDNFNLIDTKTTASSNILKDYISPYNATVVERLIEAGSVILGKTNMDAFAHGSSTETSDFGVTKNAIDQNRVAGGSSGGSASAVATDMATYGIGSETAGSVRGPAAWNGIYGFAPTFGRNSRYGVMAMASSLDRPGVLANSVEDCAIVTDVIDGVDKRDATSIQEKSTNYAGKLSVDKKDWKLGIPKQFMDSRIDKEVSERCMSIIKEYEKLGAKITEIDLLDPKYSIAVYTVLCRSEVSSNLARIDGIRYGHHSDQKVESIIEQVLMNRGEGFGNEAKQRSMTGAYTLSVGHFDAYYLKAQKVRTLIIEDFKKAFESVDLIVGPTMPTVAPKIGVTKNNPIFGELADILTEPSALAGLPCISIPVGNNSEGLPIGMQIFGAQMHEQDVLDLAYIFEQKINK